MSKYVPQVISGYNTTPPPDDGSQVALNEITWAGIKTKLTDPIKDLSEGINTAVTNLAATSFLRGVSAETADFSVAATDRGMLFSTVNPVEAALPSAAAADVGDGWSVTFLNSDVTNKFLTLSPDGSETISGQTTLRIRTGQQVTIVSDGSNFYIAAASVGGVPIGASMDYWSLVEPPGWLSCGGQAISRTTYELLYNTIGSVAGDGDGSTTFNVPDKRGRVSAGLNDLGGTGDSNRLAGVPGSLNADVIAAAGGVETHILSNTELPNTAVINTAKTQAGSGGAVDVFQGSGGGQPHNNVQPTIACNYMIFTGVFT